MNPLARLALSPDDGLSVVRAIRREIARLDRRLKAIERDIARAEQALALQHQAELLARSKLPKRGAHAAEVIDYACDPPLKKVIALDPALEPRAQVDAWFKTARRYLRGADLGQARMVSTQHERAFLLSAAAVFEEEQSSADARLELRSDPRVARLITPAMPITGQRAEVGRGSHGAPMRVPFRTFLGHGGDRILVGRGARDNDELTTRIARPQDLFLHVHGIVGAHVIVPRNKGALVPAELLLDAAHLAHHFSGAAAEPGCDVAYVERRHVQKRRGSPPGTVHLLREKVLRLAVEPARLHRLLAAELRAP